MYIRGPQLQGVKLVIATSYERIHRSNLVGMGIVPLQFKEGETLESLGLNGKERFSVGKIKIKKKMNFRLLLFFLPNYTLYTVPVYI